MTGIDIKNPDNLWLTVTSMNLRTGSELVNANTHGNAEVPDNVKDKDGATEMMPAKKFTNEGQN
jgi:hypothetical protein